MKTQQTQQNSHVRTYKRLQIEGGCCFFTVNLANRQHDDLLVREIEALRDAFRQTRADHPFEIDAIVVLPEHLHTIWQLPPHDSDFSTRWRLIKSRFSQAIKTGEHISESRLKKVNAESGNVDSGNISSATTWITRGTLITSTTTRSNTGTARAQTATLLVSTLGRPRHLFNRLGSSRRDSRIVVQ